MSTIESDFGMAQEERVTRALSEMSEWTFRFFDGAWEVTTKGGTYRVWRNACTCEDHVRRCAGSECRCKHVVALGIRLMEGMTPGQPVSVPALKAAPSVTLPRMSDAEVEWFDSLFE